MKRVTLNASIAGVVDVPAAMVYERWNWKRQKLNVGSNMGDSVQGFEVAKR